MIIKLVHKPQHFPILKDGEHTGSYQTFQQEQVFGDVVNYSIETFFTEKQMINHSLRFTFTISGKEPEELKFDLMNYDEVYVMNSEGKTIDKIRNIWRTDVFPENLQPQEQTEDIKLQIDGKSVAKIVQRSLKKQSK